MTKYVNNTGISLSVAVYLATDHYDYNYDPNYYSATTLIKPIKEIILSKRVDLENVATDIATKVQSQSGTAWHSAIEYAWLNNHKQALKDLGYPQRIIDKIEVNPTDVKPGMIPVYLERRKVKDFNGLKIGGKFDFCADGILEDFKQTQTYSYTSGNNDKGYSLQGSIYKWLFPEFITKDYMRVQYLFTDWKLFELKKNPNTYPPHRQMSVKIDLMSKVETEQYIRNKTDLIKRLRDAPEDQIPECTSEDLWMSDPIWKYYKNPNKTGKSTKNFTVYSEALTRLVKDNNVGILVKVEGKVKRCEYCSAFTVCKQKDKYI